MGVSPSASATLYRNLWRGVILALVLTQFLAAQTKPSTKKAKGPRALALLELAPNGTAHLIPVVIMVDGEFYDASAYKASPVPMTLESGTVYEAERAGTSLGLFTVTGALEGPNNTWAGAGTWVPAGTKAANAPHKAESKPRDLEDTDSRPVLRRRAEKHTPPEPSAPAAPATPAQASPAPAPSSPPAPAPSVAPAPPPAPKPPPAAASQAPPDEDADRPVLKRGKPAPAPKNAAQKKPATSSSAPAKTAATPATKESKNTASAIQILPAISDAGGPEPHTYVYPAKPEDEEQFRKKTLAMAANEVAAYAKLASQNVAAPEALHASPSRAKAAAPKAPQPAFDDIQFHVLDVSTNNEPVLVLTATAHLPQAKAAGSADLPYMLTLVARQDIYGELHKVFSNVTDARHLDVLPRYDFIDVVDADGDGRGELLFRKVSDTASAFSVYRVIGNQLWPLFDGRPGS